MSSVECRGCRAVSVVGPLTVSPCPTAVPQPARCPGGAPLGVASAHLRRTGRASQWSRGGSRTLRSQLPAWMRRTADDAGHDEDPGLVAPQPCAEAPGLDRLRHCGVRLTLRLAGVASECAVSGVVGRDRLHERYLHKETSVSSTHRNTTKTYSLLQSHTAAPTHAGTQHVRWLAPRGLAQACIAQDETF